MSVATDPNPPVIGIAASARRLELPFATVDAQAVFSAYVEAVAAAGGLPVLLPMMDPVHAQPLVAAVDGLVLTGGVDLDPASYGLPSEHATGPVDPQRDRFEIALAREAHGAGVPTLGVCRGLHVLNVAMGGSLAPHVDGHLGRDLRHEVDVVASSLLGALLGTSLRTGSLHHQAADRIGEGLRAVATAADGSVEAIEAVAGGPALGVQWHPELEPGPASAALFGWLVRAARRSRWT